MAEHINKTDTLNEGRVKLNAAISDSNIAKDKSTQALANSESTQIQLDTIVIEGDSSVEAAQARVDEKGEGHATLKARIDDGFERTSSQMAKTTPKVYVESYPRFEGELDDTGRISRSIEYAHSIGGGIVVLSAKDYHYSSIIHILKNVYLEGTKDTNLIFNGIVGGGLAFHKYSSFNKSTLYFPDAYNDSAFLFAGENLPKRSGDDDKTIEISYRNVKISDVEITSNHTGNTPNKVAFKYFADEGQGFFGVHLERVTSKGFEVVEKIETKGTGWVNGSLSKDIYIEDFKHAVVTDISPNSRGVDLNVHDHWIIQPDSKTRELFLDDSISNQYINLEIYDLHVFTDTRIGYVGGHMSNRLSTYNQIKERYSRRISPERYYMLGVFNSVSTIHYAKFSFNDGRGRDTLVTINNGNEVVRQHFGTTPVNNESISFYTRSIGNNKTELYLKSLGSVDLNLSVYAESSIRFTMSHEISFVELSGLIDSVEKESITYGTLEQTDDYIRYNDGTMIAWGLYENTSEEVMTTDEVTNLVLMKGKPIVFQKPFTRVLDVQCTSRRDFNPVSISVNNVTNNGFTPHLYTRYDSLSTAHMFHYKVTGRWK